MLKLLAVIAVLRPTFANGEKFVLQVLHHMCDTLNSLTKCIMLSLCMQCNQNSLKSQMYISDSKIYGC